MDILGSLDKDRIMNNARNIASFLKQSNGDFSSITTNDIIAVLQQMSNNEKLRKQKSKGIKF